MSHMTLEYSANLRAGGNFGYLCRKLALFMVDLQGDGKQVFPPGGVRVRAVPCEDFCIAILKIGAGRSAAVKQTTCDGLFEIMKAHFADQFARQGLALSLEMSDFSEAGTLKHNNLHARLKRT
jgi:5-carboxymethyl-2-hydroxymuconate isomerase